MHQLVAVVDADGAGEHADAEEDADLFPGPGERRGVLHVPDQPEDQTNCTGAQISVSRRYQLRSSVGRQGIGVFEVQAEDPRPGRKTATMSRSGISRNHQPPNPAPTHQAAARLQRHPEGQRMHGERSCDAGIMGRPANPSDGGAFAYPIKTRRVSG
jgi:nucleoid DNA-binding protein